MLAVRYPAESEGIGVTRAGIHRAEPGRHRIRQDESIAASAARICLHYRPINQQAKWKSIEAPPEQQSFTISADDVSSKWDLMYYFEVLNPADSGWFQPDPHTATPYYVVRVNPN